MGIDMDESSQATARRVVAICIALTSLLFAACGGGGGGSGGPPPPPSAIFSYASPQVYVVGTAITPLAPVATESLSGFAVEEILSAGPLPAGLTLNPSTGVISGTPVYTGYNVYTITAQTASGQGVSANLTITVNAVGASVISYGASALTFTAGIAARTLTPQTGVTVSGWSISPQLPAGLAFSTTTGAITGTPTAALSPTMYTVTARNSAGQPLSGQLTIEVDTQVLVNLGHNTSIELLQLSGSSFLSGDQFGNWVLWNYATGAMISSGTDCAFSGQPGPLPCIRGPDAALAGSTAVIRTYGGFDVLSAATGALIANIPVVLDSASEDTGGSWWLLATDGSYIVAGTTQSLSAWSPSGQLLASRSGNYSAAIPFASPGAIRIAVGPAGSNVVETVSIPSGADTVSPTFNGQFASWFVDGSAFLSTVGNTTLVYSDAVSQEAVLSTPASGLSGEGPWLWTSGTSLNIYAVTSPTTLVASYPCSGSVATSASTIAVFSFTSDTVCLIDLSGAAPAEATYSLPLTNANGAIYAAASASQWVVAVGNGVLLDGASLSGTTRFFDYGALMSIAGNANQIAIATASGAILYFNAVTLAQEGTIQLPSTQLALSPDGSILAATSSMPSNPATQSLNIYSLPSASLLYSWPPSSSTTVASIALSGSGSGTVLGQVLSSGTITVSAPTGGTPTFSTTGSMVALSPDGTLIATSDTADPASGEVGGNFTDFATNILQNNKVVTAVSGWPVGWLDDSHLLVNTYQLDYLVNQADYNGCAIYGPTGMSAGTCNLPQLLSFQTVTSDTIYALNLNEIISVSTRAVSWASGNAASGESPTSPSLPNLTYADALAGNHVIFVSGSKVVAQSY
jgi:hypothetical protein